MRTPAERVGLTDRDFLVLVPAFLTSELRRAFEIGFLLFIPFLVVDLVISNLLLALGMHMLSPTTVSLPFKLLLFVLADGWQLLLRGLVESYV
jgi:type III secretion protein R